jgi:hypothetical protein
MAPSLANDAQTRPPLPSTRVRGVESVEMFSSRSSIRDAPERLRRGPSGAATPKRLLAAAGFLVTAGLLIQPGLVSSGRYGGVETSTADGWDASALRPGEPVVADFNADDVPDKAVLVVDGGTVKTIRVKLGGLLVRQFSFDSGTEASGTLIARDVNHDGHLDLVWLSPERPLSAVVWIGDGSGHFVRVLRAPEPDPGRSAGLLPSSGGTAPPRDRTQREHRTVRRAGAEAADPRSEGTPRRLAPRPSGVPRTSIRTSFVHRETSWVARFHNLSPPA